MIEEQPNGDREVIDHYTVDRGGDYYDGDDSEEWTREDTIRLACLAVSLGIELELTGNCLMTVSFVLMDPGSRRTCAKVIRLIIRLLRKGAQKIKEIFEDFYNFYKEQTSKGIILLPPPQYI